MLLNYIEAKQNDILKRLKTLDRILINNSYEICNDPIFEKEYNLAMISYLLINDRFSKKNKNLTDNLYLKLLELQHSNGQYGVDFYDTTIALKALLLESESYVETINKTVCFINENKDVWQNDVKNNLYGIATLVNLLDIVSLEVCNIDINVTDCIYLIDNYIFTISNSLEEISVEHEGAILYNYASAIRYLSRINSSIAFKHTNILEWILNTQNNSGSWGGEKGFFTAYALEILLLYSQSNNEGSPLYRKTIESIEKGIGYLLYNDNWIIFINSVIVNNLFLGGIVID